MSAPQSDASLLAALVRSADEAIVGHTLDGIVRTWNAAAARLFGYSADEIVGTNLARLVPPGQLDDTRELLGRIERGERVERHETLRLSRDFRALRVSLTLSPIRDDDGTLIGASTIAREVGDPLEYGDLIAGPEERFRGIVEAAPNALVIVDEAGRIEYANARFVELFGVDAADLPGIEISQLLPGKSADRSSILVGPAQFPAEVDRPDTIGRRADGSEFPVEVGINTFRAHGRRLVAASIVDLSARRAIENEVIEVARQQAAIADLGRHALQGAPIPDILAEAADVVARVLDVDVTEVLQRDGEADDLLLSAGRGWGTGAVGGLRVDLRDGTFAGDTWRADDAIVAGSDSPPGSPALEPALVDRGVVTGMRMAIPGRTAPFGILGAHRRARRPFGRRDRNFLRAVANVLGTTIGHRRAADDLGSTTTMLNALVMALPIAVTVADADGTVRVLNPAAEQLYGWAAAEIVGSRYLERLGDEDDQDDDGVDRAEIHHRLLGGEIIRGVDAHWTRRDGSVVEVQIHGAPLRDTEGAITGVVVLHVDVTATRRLEEELLQAQKMESIGRLAGGVAHDFNNLLTGIFGYAALLEDELQLTDAGARELVQGIHDSAAKAAALTAQLLAFSRRQVLKPRVIDLNEAIAGIEPLLRRIIGEHISLATIPRAGIGRIRADPSQLEQVIVNLVVNARDAMPDGGTVSIETGLMAFDEVYAQEHFDVSPGDYSMLAVTDEGVGMDADTRLHLFEPFFTTKGPGKGTGLGLATTYGIVKQSGGHIWLYSEPGRGTTFKLYFPTVPIEQEARPPERSKPAPVRGTETVLFVEDEDAVRSIVQTVLARRGYRVLAASNGPQAIAIAQAHDGPIHLVVTDVVMPGMGGRELAAAVARIRPGIRTLFISGYTEDAIVRQGVLDANVAFLPKPFSPDQLARTVSDVLAAPATGASHLQRA